MRGRFFLLLMTSACGAFSPAVGAPLPADAAAAEAAPEAHGHDAAASATDAAPAATTWTVLVAPDRTLSLRPAELTIQRGDTVRWIWKDGGHTVTSGSASPDGKFCSPLDANCSEPVRSPTDTVYEHRFDEAGRFPYFCSPHRSEGMTGVVTVLP